MPGDGEWHDSYSDGTFNKLPVVGATLSLPPLYQAEIRVDHARQTWVGTLNGREIVAGRSMEHARAAIDYRIWTEVRQIREPYKALMDRRATWSDGCYPDPSCVSLAVPGLYEPVFPVQADCVRIGEEMCRDYRRRRAMGDYYAGFSEMKIRILSPPPHQAPNLQPQDDVNPTDPAPIFRMRAEGDGTEMITARWWFMPRQQKGSFKDFRKRYATFNARSDKVERSPFFRESFAQRRCLVPADGWYEWTGVKYPKTKWLFTPMDGNWMCFAGIWDHVETEDEGPIDTFTLITHAAGQSLQKYHDRAPVVMPKRDWSKWLDPEFKKPMELIGPESLDQYSVTYHSGPNPIG